MTSWHYAASCEGKHGYRSPSKAWEVARRYAGKEGDCRAYRCSHCGLYHVGTRPERNKRKQARRAWQDERGAEA